MHVEEITRESLPDLSKGEGHKYDHGHALVLCGPPGQGGAARLAARGALRIGAGLVTLACPLRALYENSAQLNAIMTRPIDGPSGLAELLEDERLSAACVGPGLGLTHVTADLTRVTLGAGKPTVLDADALSRFQRAPEALFEQLHANAVLTPHDGEFGRLFPDLAEGLGTEGGDDRVNAVATAASRSGAIVLLKGVETLIAAPDGRIARHRALAERAAPWLATAGSGDVLAGFICGLMARGVPPFEAATAATWMHVECARIFGPGLIAEDLPEQIPAVLRSLQG